MAKKKRKHYIKLNNKIREIFKGEPFDDGIAKVEDEILMELTLLLNLNLEDLNRETLIKALRRAWSNGEYSVRKVIVDYLKSRKRDTKGSKSKDSLDRVALILDILEDTERSREEEEQLLESFLELPIEKITKEKLLNKLEYIRFKESLSKIANELNIEFSPLGEILFSHPFNFTIDDFSFTKHLLLKGRELDLKHLLKTKELKDVISLLEREKERLINEKAKEIELFLSSIKSNRYLKLDEIKEQLKRVPIDRELYHTPIDYTLVDRALHSIDKDIEILPLNDSFLIEKQKSLEIFGRVLNYKLSISYQKDFIYASIWENRELPLIEDFNTLNQNSVKNFLFSINSLKEHMLELAKGLNIKEETIEGFILQFLEPQLLSSPKLKLKEKSRRRILYHYEEYLRPIREKKLREELLAKTIRDFKLLFPTARAIKRKIIFNVGPTNSGKTYEAMMRLKDAKTGYYLAPLRLLALEGYERLKSYGVRASLITGEEEIIDEDSTHISSTIEMLNPEVEVDCCVIDEIQMINDRDRGWAWANALIGAPAKEVILTGSANAIEAVKEICDYLQEPLEINYFERKAPLKALAKPTSINKIEPHTAIVAFSRKEVLALKQKLSSKYSVSVVYGNLSPEVRREEARRFREGESEVLVATDAIAMGLNLPIKTILFSRDNKFDGLRRRELDSSEVLQIAGRAGRYGLHEEGFVGALDYNTLQSISSKLNTKLRDIKLPLSVMASLEHVILIGEILETTKLQEILEFFAQNMEFEGPFEAANIDSMLELAEIVDEYDLDLRSRYHLACAPVTLSSPYIEGVYRRYLTLLERGEIVPYRLKRELVGYARTNEELLNAEDRVKEVSLYLWLSFKFRDKFLDVKEAQSARDKLNRFIELTLKKGDLIKRCRRCQKELDFSYRFSICEECHQRGRRLNRGYRRK